MIHDAARRLVRALARRSRCSARGGDLPARRGARRRARWRRPLLGASSARVGFVGAFVAGGAPLRPQRRRGTSVIADAIMRDRLGALAAIIIAGAGLLAVVVSYARADARRPRRRVLRAARGGRRRDGASSSAPTNLMTLFLGLEWFSICLYILCAIDIELEGVARGGAEVPDRRRLRLGGAALRLGARLRRDRRARFARDRRRRRRRTSHDALLVAGPRDDPRRARLQGLGGAVPHVDAGRLRGRADAGDRRSCPRRRRRRRSF